jgi:WD40 repeat protein
VWDTTDLTTAPPVLAELSHARVRSAAFAPDGRTLATGGEHIKLWDVAAWEERATLRGHTGPVCAVAFAPGGTLASGGQDRAIRLWEARLPP